MEESLSMPLNKAQLELLKLFSRANENDLIEIKVIVEQYLANKAQVELNQLRDQRGDTNGDLARLTNAVG